MYRNCIFCSANLGSNDFIGRFPVGRSLAFDGEKGRLWAVCPRCARWNLAPIEERWEAIEAAERLFRRTHTRVQNENVGVAKLRDGTRLIRLGQALPGELAAWRYGPMMLRRHQAHKEAERMSRGVGIGLGAGIPTAMAVSAAAGVASAAVTLGVATFVLMMWGGFPARTRLRPLLPGTGVVVDAVTLNRARFALTSRGEVSVALADHDEDDAWRLDGEFRGGWLIPSPGYARTLLRRAMVHLNAQGAPRDFVNAATGLLAEHGSGEEFLRRAAVDRARLTVGSMTARARAWALAVEMAVHDEMERAALRGELAALEAAWRQAEEIAAIADRLPNLVAPDPPRLAKQ